MKKIIRKIVSAISGIRTRYAGSWFAGLTVKQKAVAVWFCLSLCGMCTEVDFSRPDWWLQLLLLVNFGAASWCCAKHVPLRYEVTDEPAPADGCTGEPAVRENDDCAISGTEEYYRNREATGSEDVHSSEDYTNLQM